MKTIYLTLAIFGLISFQTFGQTYTWVTNDTIETNLDLNTTVQHAMHQEAIGTNEVTLAIEVIHNDIPAAWDGMICIFGSCLGTIPVVGTQATMDPISGSNQGMVRLTVNPFNGTETAKLQVYVYDVNFPNDGDTATWLLNTTLYVEETLWEDLSIYPNPVNEVLKIETENNVDFVEIHSLNGKLVARFDELKNGSLNLSNIDSGAYLLKLVQPNGNFTVRKFNKL